MKLEQIAKITKALNSLDNAINTAALSVSPLACHDTELTQRMESYKEVVRRQRNLVDQLSQAVIESRWSEVMRTALLVQRASDMIRLDASRILEALRELKSNQARQAA